MDYKRRLALDIARKALDEGLRVWLSKDGKGHYGCYTDDAGTRVVSFDADMPVRFHGHYKSERDGTGWRICDEVPDRLRDLLHAYPWEGIRFMRFTTIEQHLQTYGASSCYVQVTELPAE